MSQTKRYSSLNIASAALLCMTCLWQSVLGVEGAFAQLPDKLNQMDPFNPKSGNMFSEADALMTNSDYFEVVADFERHCRSRKDFPKIFNREWVDTEKYGGMSRDGPIGPMAFSGPAGSHDPVDPELRAKYHGMTDRFLEELVKEWFALPICPQPPTSDPPPPAPPPPILDLVHSCGTAHPRLEYCKQCSNQAKALNAAADTFSNLKGTDATCLAAKNSLTQLGYQLNECQETKCAATLDEKKTERKLKDKTTRKKKGRKQQDDTEHETAGGSGSGIRIDLGGVLGGRHRNEHGNEKIPHSEELGRKGQGSGGGVGTGGGGGIKF